MIKVSLTLDKIQVSGHANMAPKGSDIVCAAVTAITLTLIQGLENIAYMSLYKSIQPGNICIEWQSLTDTGKALIDTWFLGILGIAEEYPVIKIVPND